ncbi:MAG: DUF6557 family protein [Clostridia bacterium]
MIFKDLLMQASVEEVVNSITKRFEIDETKYCQVLDKHNKLFEILYELEPINTNNIIVCSTCESFDESFISESIYDLDEIKNNDEIEKELKRLENIGIDEIQKIIGITKLPQGFSMMYVPWEEILGYQVSEKNIADIGKADFVATIIYEMTFFGFTQEELNAEREKLEKIIEEQKEIEKLPEEERAKHYVSIEDLFDDLDDDNDEEQEKIDTENNSREWLRNKKRELEVLVDIKNKLSL